jgi:hypothetical protein
MSRSTTSSAAGYHTVIRSSGRFGASRRLAVGSAVTRCNSPTGAANVVPAARRMQADAISPQGAPQPGLAAVFLQIVRPWKVAFAV